jgi:heme exporter protein C
MDRKGFAWEHPLGLLGLVLLLAGSYIGLFATPPERFMGEVQRIMYVHVPSAWNALLCFTFAFAVAIGSLWSGKRRWDAILTGSIEAGVLLNALLLLQGSIWARATWGVWWDWDVRLTTSLVMLLLFGGVLALRSFIEDQDRRASWTAVASIVAYVDVPLVYFCVRWWRSLHQIQSSPETVHTSMQLPLRINAIALLLIATWFIARRARLELQRQEREQVALPEPISTAQMEGISNV